MDVHVDNFGSCCAVVVVMQALRPSFLNGLPVYALPSPVSDGVSGS